MDDLPFQRLMRAFSLLKSRYIPMEEMLDIDGFDEIR